MSSILKCLLGLFAVLCFMQFVEMARVRRDDAPAAAGNGAAGLDLNDALNSIMQKIKGSLDEDTLNNVMKLAQNALDQGTKAVKEGLGQLNTAAGKLSGGAVDAGAH